MSTNFPTSLDSFTNPDSDDLLSDSIGSRTHSQFHADINDAMETVQAKLGTDSSTVKSSHSYMLSDNNFAHAIADDPGPTISSETFTRITIPIEQFDTSDNFSDSRFTVPTGAGGYYFVVAGFSALAAAANARHIVLIYKNGAQVAQGRTTSVAIGVSVASLITAVIHLDATEYVEAYCWHDSGDDLVLGGATRTFIQVIRLQND